MKRGDIITEAVTRGLNPAAFLRDAGIPWLGQVPTHWEVKRLKFLAGDGKGAGIQIGPFGGMLTELTYAEAGEFKLYGQENVLSGDFDKGTRWLTAEQYADLSQYATEEGDFLFTRKGSIGGCAIFPENAHLGIIDSDTIRLRVNPRTLSTRFLLHAFRESEYLQFQVQLVKRGAILSGLNTTTITNLVLVTPPLDEQIAIAAFLDWKTGQIDALIARKKELLERLKEKRLAVIAQAVTRGLKPTAPLRDSGVPWVGHVPEHWEVKRIKFIARIGNGSTPSRENSLYWDDGYYPWLNSSVVNQEAVTMADQFVTADALRECHLPIVQPPAVLIGITGEGKTRGMATTLLFEATINQHLAYVKPDPALVKVDFLRRVFDKAYSYLRSESDGGGSTKGAITCEQIAELPVPVPPVNEQEAIAAHLEIETQRMDRLSARIEAAVERLAEYRTALITAATTGKIDVRGVKIPHSV